MDCRQVTKIDAILAAAKSRAIELNTVAYNSGIGSYLSLGDYEKALELYALMRTRNVKPDAVTYNVLNSGSCKLGKYAQSLNFFEEMMDLKIHLTKEVYSSVICSYVKQVSITDIYATWNICSLDLELWCRGYCKTTMQHILIYEILELVS